MATFFMAPRRQIHNRFSRSEPRRHVSVFRDKFRHLFLDAKQIGLANLSNRNHARQVVTLWTMKNVAMAVHGEPIERLTDIDSWKMFRHNHEKCRF
jgi:hypothetical protein